MKQVQISEDLFLSLIKYHILECHNDEEKIVKGLKEKYDSIINRNLYTKYKTAPSKEEKEKYNEKKLCRTVGIGMSVITLLILIMGLLENILPAFFAYIALGIIIVDVVVIIILGNTICRK